MAPLQVFQLFGDFPLLEAANANWARGLLSAFQRLLRSLRCVCPHGENMTQGHTTPPLFIHHVSSLKAMPETRGKSRKEIDELMSGQAGRREAAAYSPLQG